MKKEKQIIKDFYDGFGWHKNEDGIYRDVATFVDTRSVLDEYRHKTHMRVRRLLNPEGDYYLDAGSGAVAHAEHLAYSSDYRWRVCVDLSQQALVEAREKVGDKGLVVQADVTQLPFKDGVFGAIVLAHVLYHVPRDEQTYAMEEMVRTLKQGRSGVIIYAWNMGLLRILARFVRWLRRIIQPKRSPSEPSPDHRGSKRNERPQIYSHHHGYRWFRRNVPDDWRMSLHCWRSVDRVFTRVFIPNNILGKWMMRLVYGFEEAFPYMAARLGRYPIIVIQKK
jgi:SAM-dependent methyltransferase